MQVLVLGANSDVALVLSRTLAESESADLYLASRDTDLLTKRAKDIEIRHHVKASAEFFDATDFASHAAFYESLDPSPDVVVVAFGYLGDQCSAQQEFHEARRIVETNFLGAVSVLEIVASDFEARRAGLIIGISSVAGERGRQSNYVYGAAKAGFTTYLSGLRNRLHPCGVRVLTVLPGFIRTKMTAGLDLPRLLVATPEQVARDVYRAFRRGLDIVYTRWYWRWIVGVIGTIPEPLFKRLRL